MRRRWLIQALPLLIFLALVPAHVSAQSSELYIQKAKKLYSSGFALAKDKKYTEALIEFKTAVSLVQNAISSTQSISKKNKYKLILIRLLYTIGRTHQYQRDWKKAFETYERCLKQGAPQDVRKQIKELMPQLLPHLKSVLRVTTRPKGAFVLIETSEGFKKRQTPFSLRLSPGSVSLTMTSPGYRRLQKGFVVGPKTNVSKHFELEPDEKIATNPLPRRLVTPPRGRRRWPSRGRVPRRATPSKGPGVLPWIFVGAGALAIGAGAVVLGLGQADLSTARSEQDRGLALYNSTPKDKDGNITPPNHENVTTIARITATVVELGNSGDAKTVAGWVILGGGVLLGAVGVVLFLLPRPTQPTGAPQALPACCEPLPAVGGVFHRSPR